MLRRQEADARAPKPRPPGSTVTIAGMAIARRISAPELAADGDADAFFATLEASAAGAAAQLATPAECVAAPHVGRGDLAAPMSPCYL